jgi:hypothetical protein
LLDGHAKNSLLDNRHSRHRARLHFHMATWLCRAVHERRGLHADSLLWSRDLLVRGTRGAVDIPRLIEGHVALQAFTVVTKTPRGLNFQRNAGDSDNITMLALVERWPPATWSSLTERALYQASRLRDFESRSQGKFTIVRSAAGLRAYLDRRRTDPAITASFLGNRRGTRARWQPCQHRLPLRRRIPHDGAHASSITTSAARRRAWIKAGSRIKVAKWCAAWKPSPRVPSLSPTRA